LCPEWHLCIIREYFRQVDFEKRHHRRIGPTRRGMKIG
jgi:hypothetical protein